MPLKILLFIITSLISNTLQAEIFICYNDSNNIRYQDSPCQNESQETLSLVTTKHIKRKRVDKIKKQLSKQIKELAKQDRLNKREHNKWLNEHKTARLKAERKQKKCDLIKYKLASANKKLQEGYTYKQKLRINEALDYYKYLKKQYCK